jgi:hypothetical protein
MVTVIYAVCSMLAGFRVVRPISCRLVSKLVMS